MAQSKRLQKNSRWRTKMRTRQSLRGSTEKPRICVFRSGKHIYAQLISDDTGVTIANASTLDKEVLESIKKLEGGPEKNSTKSIAAAKVVGKVLAERAKAKNIKKVLFDRNGFVYHGRIAGVADGAREGGLEF